jgi:protein TonB
VPPPVAAPPPEPPRPAPPRPKPRPVATSARAAEQGPPAAQVAASAAEPTPAPPRVSATWNAAIAAWLHRNKTYPQAARALGQQGSSDVRFTVARDGTVLEVHLTRTTGSSILDEAVRRLLTGARVPAFPADMPHERVTVQVQISYSLNR